MACAADAARQFMLHRLVTVATLFFAVSLVASWAL